MTTSTVSLGPAAAASGAAVQPDQTGRELKRGAFLNTIAMIASNLRGVFTFLVARMLGPAALGTFSVAWSTTDIISKVGVFGLDNTITTFIAWSEAKKEHGRSPLLFLIAIAIGVLQSAIFADLSVVALKLFGDRLGLDRNLTAALAVVVCALPGVALYRISTSVSRLLIARIAACVSSGPCSVSLDAIATRASGNTLANSSATRSTPGPQAISILSVLHSGQASGVCMSKPQ